MQRGLSTLHRSRESILYSIIKKLNYLVYEKELRKCRNISKDMYFNEPASFTKDTDDEVSELDRVSCKSKPYL